MPSASPTSATVSVRGSFASALTSRTRTCRERTARTSCSASPRVFGADFSAPDRAENQSTKSVHQLPGVGSTESRNSCGSCGVVVADAIARLLVGRRVDERRDVTVRRQHEAALPADQLHAAVAARPGADVIGDAGDDVGVDRRLRQVDRGAEHGRLARRLVSELSMPELQEVGVQLGRHPGRVGVPVEDVERGRALAQQVVVHPVVPHQVAGAQPGEDGGEGAAVEEAVGARFGGRGGHQLGAGDRRHQPGAGLVEHRDAAATNAARRFSCPVATRCAEHE